MKKLKIGFFLFCTLVSLKYALAYQPINYIDSLITDPFYIYSEYCQDESYSYILTIETAEKKFLKSQTTDQNLLLKVIKTNFKNLNEVIYTNTINNHKMSYPFPENQFLRAEFTKKDLNKKNCSNIKITFTHSLIMTDLKTQISNKIDLDTSINSYSIKWYNESEFYCLYFNSLKVPYNMYIHHYKIDQLKLFLKDQYKLNNTIGAEFEIIDQSSILVNKHNELSSDNNLISIQPVIVNFKNDSKNYLEDELNITPEIVHKIVLSDQLTITSKFFFISFHGDNLKNSAKQSTLIYDRVQKKVVNTINAYNPYRIDDNHIAFFHRSGGNENSIWIYNTINQNITKLENPSIGNYGYALHTRQLISASGSNFLTLFSSIMAYPQILIFNLDLEYKLFLPPNFKTQQNNSDISTPQISTYSNLSDIQSVRKTYNSSRGLKLPYIQYNLSKSNIKYLYPHKYLIFLHGGNSYYSSYFHTEKFDPTFVNLIQSGINFIAPTIETDAYSNSDFLKNINQTTSDGSFDEINRGAQDIVSLANQIKNENPEAEIYIWGHSYGAAVVNAVSSRYSHLFNFNGIVSQCGPWINPVRGLRTSLQTDILKIKSPILLACGQEDNYFYPEEQWAFDTLKNSGQNEQTNQTESYFPISTGHTFDINPDWYEWNKILLNFIQIK